MVNLNVKVDADTGKILGSAKKAISTYIDDGVLLDYLPMITYSISSIMKKMILVMKYYGFTIYQMDKRISYIHQKK